MARILTKGSKFFLAGTAAPLSLTPTAISSAAPAVVTVADASGVTAGDYVKLQNTGFSDLDGKAFAVGTVDGGANTFELVGSDTTGTSDTLAASPEALLSARDSMTQVCLESITLDAASVSQIDLSDFCEDKTLPGSVTLGGVSFRCWVDDATNRKAQLAALEKAAADQIERPMLIVMPNNKGYVTGAVSIGAVSPGVERNGAYDFTVSGTQAEQFRIRLV